MDFYDQLLLAIQLFNAISTTFLLKLSYEEDWFVFIFACLWSIWIYYIFLGSLVELIQKLYVST